VSDAAGSSIGGDKVGPEVICATLRRLAAKPASAEGASLAPGLSSRDRRAVLEAADLIERAYLPSSSRPTEGRHLMISIDGAARGNPGPAGIGVMIREEGGPFKRKVWEYIGEATNNVAEYHALLLALREAGRLKASRVKIRSDSELLVRQMNGRYRVRHPRLIELHSEARDLMRIIPSFQIEHIGRELNAEADALANRAIDEALAGARLEKERS